MKRSLIYIAIGFIGCAISLTSCKKADAPPPNNNPTPTPIPTKNCAVTGISQLNTGGKPDFALSITTLNNNISKLVVFDSLINKKTFEASFTYTTTDSIRIDQYQYLKLDGNKRVIRLVTKSDMSIPSSADDYRYEYIYNSEGFLINKLLFINGSVAPFYSTSYTYTNGLLTKCVVTISGNNNPKILESDLTYDETITVKNWIYSFPDAFESYLYNTALNFGTKGTKALKQVVTKIYNPANGTTLDTWTTNYTNYVFNADGYLQSATANGDLQQGMASFYGKTAFYYTCQ